MPDSGEVVKLPQIAARERGPGPARYLLKTLSKHADHDITKYRNPAFSFGSRLQPVKTFNSPGPCHLPMEGVNRYGANGSFKYSMLGGATSDKMTKIITPGPACNKKYQNEFDCVSIEHYILTNTDIHQSLHNALRSTDTKEIQGSFWKKDRNHANH
ncbi:hypothetical protein ACROYT_G006497 [Oculina patagonica]